MDKFTGRLLLWEQGNPVYFNAAWYSADKRYIGPAHEIDVQPLSLAHRLESMGDAHSTLGVVTAYIAFVYRVRPEQADVPCLVGTAND